MPIVHNSTIEHPSAGQATEVQTPKANCKHGRVLDMADCGAGMSVATTTIPTVLASESQRQPVGGGTEIALLRVPPTSCAGALRVQLQSGAAAAAAAAAAATVLRSHVAAQATITAFAAAATAQATISAQAVLGAPLIQRMQQAPVMAPAGTPGSTCAATLLVRQSKLLNNLHHRQEHARRQQATLAVASTTIASDTSSCSSFSSNSSSRSAINGRSKRCSGRDCLPGAAYFLIPQPAYHDDHRTLQSRGNASRSGSTSSSLRAAGWASTAAFSGSTADAERQHLSTRPPTDAVDVMLRPAMTAQPVASKRRCREGPRAPSFRSGCPQKASIQQRRREPGPRKCGAFAGSGDCGGHEGGPRLSAEARLERSREQNRQSSKKARIRRKGEEESLMDQIQTIQVGERASGC